MKHCQREKTEQPGKTGVGEGKFWSVVPQFLTMCEHHLDHKSQPEPTKTNLCQPQNKDMFFTFCFFMQATCGVGFYSGISTSATCPHLSSLRRHLLGERHKRIIGGKNMVRWMTEKCLGSWVEVAISIVLQLRYSNNPGVLVTVGTPMS